MFMWSFGPLSMNCIWSKKEEIAERLVFSILRFVRVETPSKRDKWEVVEIRSLFGSLV